MRGRRSVDQAGYEEASTSSFIPSTASERNRLSDQTHAVCATFGSAHLMKPLLVGGFSYSAEVDLESGAARSWPERLEISASEAWGPELAHASSEIRQPVVMADACCLPGRAGAPHWPLVCGNRRLLGAAA